VAQTLSDSSPASMREVAQRYGKLFGSVHKHWQEEVQTAATNHTALPTALSDPEQEALRQVMYSADAPVNVPSGAIVDVEWFFDEPTRVELSKLQAEIDRWNIKSPGAPPHAVILEDRSTQRNPRVFLRGNPANKGDEVPRRFLEVLEGENRQPFNQGSGRLELAQAIANTNNPLTARVMVNRIWLHHFGAGLVRTPSDFGTRSEPPSHPELLDWLARRFMADGWSIKKLHRLIMLSSVYQQSSDAAREGQNSDLSLIASSRNGKLDPEKIDPENRLLWRMNRQRLDFESMRDSLLAVSGKLNWAMGGKANELTKKPMNTSRTIYGYIDRQFLPGVFRVFDFANPDMHAPQRYTTTVPQQALFFMNSSFVVEQARALANRPEVAAINRPDERIRHLYELAYQREPTDRQLDAGLRFVKKALTEPTPVPPKPIIPSWQYGCGEYDEGSQRIKSFQPLPYFSGEAWQGGTNWPDSTLGWVQLKADGGHAGNDLQHASIRRWVAPEDCVVIITGTLAHSHKEGDGIRARVVTSRGGQLGSWTLHNDKAEIKFESVEVKRGETIDFVVDPRDNLNSDDFTWAPVIKLANRPTAASSAGDSAAEWDAKKDFGGPPEPPPQPLNAWEKYAQALLLSNEFMFVD